MSRIKSLLAGLLAALASSHSYDANANVQEPIGVGRAHATIRHCRPKHFVVVDGVKQAAYLDDAGQLVVGHKWIDSPLGPVVDPSTMYFIDEDETHNVKTNNGMDFIHTQCYGSSGLGANGLNFIALSNDTLTETTASTTLSTEITTNGLTRAAGTVAHTAGTTTTTVQKTFTCATAPQAAQKSALFTAVAAGTMNHALAFTQRSLQIGDTLQITFTITIT